MSKAPRAPAVFSLDELDMLEPGYVPGVGAPPSITPDADPFAVPADLPANELAIIPKRGRRWLKLLLGALGGLAVMAIGLAIDNLIEGLFARNDALGWIAVAFAGLAALALVAIAVREITGLLRIRRITHIHEAADRAVAGDDRDAARKIAGELIDLYSARPETARGRAELSGHVREIIDGRDLIGLAEGSLLLPLDEAARRAVMASAQRVAVVTAVSPRALVDLIFVGTEILRLVRKLATLYGGRPGTLGFLRLTRAAIGHLAVTGGMAAGDSMVSQILGHGIAARLSARLGEGVVNGLLTARVGIAAIEVCRPLPFVTGRPPRLSDVMSQLTRLGTRKES
ncbi:MAG: TIGR01620 family protein [Rhizobiales bacterium]|nr:TIGR01620 family protein [Hyphomicrobiales bacterium]